MTVICDFCEIIAGRAAVSLIAKTDDAIAFAGFRQPVFGHVLICPTRHFETIDEMDGVSSAAVMHLAVRVARAIRAELSPPGISLWQSNGEAGGQEVPHVHLHVQARAVDDGLVQIYPSPPENGCRQDLDEVAKRLRPHMAQL